MNTPERAGRSAEHLGEIPVLLPEHCALTADLLLHTQTIRSQTQFAIDNLGELVQIGASLLKIGWKVIHFKSPALLHGDGGVVHDIERLPGLRRPAEIPRPAGGADALRRAVKDLREIGVVYRRLRGGARHIV